MCYVIEKWRDYNMFHIKLDLDEVNLRYCIVAKLFFFFILSEFYAMRHNILGNNSAFPVINIKIKIAWLMYTQLTDPSMVN